MSKAVELIELCEGEFLKGKFATKEGAQKFIDNMKGESANYDIEEDGEQFVIKKKA